MPESSAFTAAADQLFPDFMVEVHEIARGGLLEDIIPEGRVSAVAFDDVQFPLRPFEPRACPVWTACVVTINRGSAAPTRSRAPCKQVGSSIVDCAHRPACPLSDCRKIVSCTPAQG